MLDAAEDPSTITDAVDQLASIIETLIRDSFGDINYGRAIAGMDVMRKEMIELEEPALYDGFVRRLKTKILTGELGGDRREMWDEIRKNKLGLVEKKLSERSKIEDEEAREVSFLALFPSPLPVCPALAFRTLTSPFRAVLVFEMTFRTP